MKFRGYDIRGIWGKDLKPEDVLKVGKAISMLSEGDIFVGMDIRLSSPEIFRYLSKSISKRFYSLGFCTTPILQYFSLKGTGIMITASHNPPEYNGFKIFRKGKPIAEEVKEMMEKVEGKEVEPNFEVINPFPEYEKEILKRFFFERKRKVVFDFLNGCGCFLKGILNKFFEAKFLNDTPDGRFPKSLPDPLRNDAIKEIKKNIKGFEFGVLFDADGDRFRVILPKKDLLPDFTAFVFSKEAKKVVIEVMMPLDLEEKLKEMGIKVYRTATGYSNCQRLAEEVRADFYAEYSGHFAFRDFYYVGDALYALLKFVELFEERDFEEYPGTPQSRIDVFCKEKYEVVKRIKEEINPERYDEVYYLDEEYKNPYLDGVDIRKGDARIVIRPSNTEPIIRVNLEKDLKTAMEIFEKDIWPIIKKRSKDSHYEIIY